MELQCFKKAIITFPANKKEDNMNNSVAATLAFILGAGVGSFVTYKLIKEKYAKMAEEDIEAMKEYYIQKKSGEENSENNSNIEDSAAKAKENRDKTNIMEYAKILNEERYSNDAPEYEAEYEVISENEFGVDDTYDTITLTYYSDGVLTDDEDEVMEDYDHVVGNFEDYYEKDSDVVYVRNDARMAYYEIVKDKRTYREVVGNEEED